MLCCCVVCCVLRDVVCCVLCVVCCVLYVVCCMLYVVCCVLCVVCYVLCVMCYVLCVVCCVLCAAGSGALRRRGVARVRVSQVSSRKRAAEPSCMRKRVVRARREVSLCSAGDVSCLCVGL